MNIYKGDVITFKPEYQDAGDSKRVFRAIEDMTKGRVIVVCDQQANMPIQPQFMVTSRIRPNASLRDICPTRCETDISGTPRASAI